MSRRAQVGVTGCGTCRGRSTRRGQCTACDLDHDTAARMAAFEAPRDANEEEGRRDLALARRVTATRTAADRFYVTAYEACVGWDDACPVVDAAGNYGPRPMTRREAWAWVRDNPQACATVSRCDDHSIVWRTARTSEDMEHAAWLSRTPR